MLTSLAICARGISFSGEHSQAAAVEDGVVARVGVRVEVDMLRRRIIGVCVLPAVAAGGVGCPVSTTLVQPAHVVIIKRARKQRSAAGIPWELYTHFSNLTGLIAIKNLLIENDSPSPVYSVMS